MKFRTFLLFSSMASLVVGCKKNEDGSEDDGAEDTGATEESSTGDVTDDGPPDTGTEETTTSGDDATTTDATTSGGSTTGSETTMGGGSTSSGSTGSGSESTGGDTGGGEGYGECQAGCMADADCCPPGTPGCPSENYPNNWTCTDGLCVFGGCENNDDCGNPNLECHPFDGVGACFDPCGNDADCGFGTMCIGMSDNGIKSCQAAEEPCDSDNDCTGRGICDPVSGSCGCVSDANCTGQDVCVMPPVIEYGECKESCMEDMDCCPLGALGCPSENYPNNWTCTDGVCVFGGCENNDDCGNPLVEECHPIDGVGTCFDPCANDADCALLLGTQCIGMADDDVMRCEAPTEPCEKDSDCLGGGICNPATGECACVSDANCTGQGGDVCVVPE